MAITLDPPPQIASLNEQQRAEAIQSWMNLLYEKIIQSLVAGNTAGGDLGGTYPDPSVDKISDGFALPTPVAGEFLKANAGNTAYEGTGFGSSANEVCEGDDSRLSDARTPTAHAASHENGGSDEIDVTDLSGLLADGQTPLAHKASHESGGSDAISLVDDLEIDGDLNHDGSNVGFFGTAPAVQQGPLTAVDGTTVDSGDSGTDDVINNTRTRLSELETALAASGLITT